jgi:hypothetical protein
VVGFHGGSGFGHIGGNGPLNEGLGAFFGEDFRKHSVERGSKSAAFFLRIGDARQSLEKAGATGKTSREIPKPARALSTDGASSARMNPVSRNTAWARSPKA